MAKVQGFSVNLYSSHHLLWRVKVYYYKYFILQHKIQKSDEILL